MNSQTQKTSSGHGSHASAPAPKKDVDDDPAWNPGKPLAALITFMEYED